MFIDNILHANINMIHVQIIYPVDNIVKKSNKSKILFCIVQLLFLITLGSSFFIIFYWKPKNL